MKKIILLIIGILVYASNPLITGRYEAVGYSAQNQPPFAAFIAAKMDAQRQLLSQIKGTKITSNTTIENGMLKSDIIKSNIQGILKGARIIDRKYDPVRRMAIVKMVVDTKKVIAAIMSDEKTLKSIEEELPPPIIIKDNNLNSSKNIVQKKFCDGLIIDVRNFNFEPAMINRIFSHSTIVYDPTKVPQSVIVERGLASYTIEINKAKGILSSYSSNNPCIVKAKNVKNKTDVIIDKKDADLITKSNNKNGFLESAKVVFVLKN